MKQPRRQSAPAMEARAEWRGPWPRRTEGKACWAESSTWACPLCCRRAMTCTSVGAAMQGSPLPGARSTCGLGVDLQARGRLSLGRALRLGPGRALRLAAAADRLGAERAGAACDGAESVAMGTE